MLKSLCHRYTTSCADTFIHSYPGPSGRNSRVDFIHLTQKLKHELCSRRQNKLHLWLFFYAEYFNKILIYNFSVLRQKIVLKFTNFSAERDTHPPKTWSSNPSKHSLFRQKDTKITWDALHSHSGAVCQKQLKAALPSSAWSHSAPCISCLDIQKTVFLLTTDPKESISRLPNRC